MANSDQWWIDELCKEHNFNAFGWNDSTKQEPGKIRVPEVDACIDWFEAGFPIVDAMKDRKSAKGYLGAYAAKHRVEHWLTKKHGISQYVPQGAIIAAAYIYGLKVRRGGNDGMEFKVGKRNLFLDMELKLEDSNAKI